MDIQKLKRIVDVIIEASRTSSPVVIQIGNVDNKGCAESNVVILQNANSYIIYELTRQGFLLKVVDGKLLVSCKEG